MSVSSPLAAWSPLATPLATRSEDADESPSTRPEVRRKQGRIQVAQILAALHQIAVAPLPLEGEQVQQQAHGTLGSVVL